jgi:hypothetical protein
MKKDKHEKSKTVELERKIGLTQASTSLGRITIEA